MNTDLHVVVQMYERRVDRARQRRTTTDREEENATENSVGRQRNSSLRSRQAVRARLLA